MYDQFVFRIKQLVWKYIGGKIGDRLLLKVQLRLGLSEMDVKGDNKST